jgi:hypothetical protein
MQASVLVKQVRIQRASSALGVEVFGEADDLLFHWQQVVSSIPTSISGEVSHADGMVLYSTICTWGRSRARKVCSCSVALCAPARMSQVVIVAWRCPKTRTAAALSNPSDSAVSTSATRTDAVLRRYSGVSRRALNVRLQAWQRKD